MTENKATSPAGSADQPRQVVLWKNVITIVGMYLAVIGLILLLTFGLFSVVSPASNTYVDIFGYLAIPVIMAAGVALMVIGIMIKSWRVRRTNPSQRIEVRLPRIDLNDPQQRRFAVVLAAGIFLLLPVLGVASYHGYHYTDSTQFCANACHTVMEPQGTAFQRSSHARVACAECHIGSGASWFVKSKLSGSRQVFKVLVNSYDRPIPPAIRHLRPSRDTCEQCHWPEKFFGSQLRSISHYASDEANTRTDVRMLVKTGGAHRASDLVEGIHAHMLELGTVEYVATDDFLQEIPWVRWVRDGKEQIFRSDGQPGTAPAPEGRRRVMDCMDCHNRPGHEFLPPSTAVNEALFAGRLDAGLPFIKREAVAALVREYPDKAAADEGIARHLDDFYRTQYAQRFEALKPKVDNAIDAVRELYHHNIFPYMRVDWRTYPNNIGHFTSPGCYRCHDGNHVTDDGVKIGHDCDTCHTFLNPVQAATGGHEFIVEGAFQHPVELDPVHAPLRCDQCHTGGPTPPAGCAQCHQDIQRLYDGTAPALVDVPAAPNPMAGIVGCTDCHENDAPPTLAAIDALCLDCHDDEPEKYEGMLSRWDANLTAASAAARGALDELGGLLTKSRTAGDADLRTWLAEQHAAIEQITRANALHNPDACTNAFAQIARAAREKASAIREGATGQP